MLRAVQIDTTIESKAITSILIDIYSHSLYLLSIRCMQGINQIGSILQAMSILSHLENYGFLRLLDDSIWRSLFVACSVISEVKFSHQATCSLFSAIKQLNIHIDAIVYSLYCRSFSRYYSQKKKNDNNLLESKIFLDPFYHLEQLGLTWMIQKLANDSNELIGQDKINNHHNHNSQSDTLKNNILSSTPPNGHIGNSNSNNNNSNINNNNSGSSGGSSIWGMFIGKKKNPVNEENISTTRQVVSSKLFLTLTSDLSKILQLSKGETLFNLKKPRNIMLASIPIQIIDKSLFPAIENYLYNDQTVDQRIRELQELFYNVHYPSSTTITIPNLSEKSLHDSETFSNQTSTPVKTGMLYYFISL